MSVNGYRYAMQRTPIAGQVLPAFLPAGGIVDHGGLVSLYSTSGTRLDNNINSTRTESTLEGEETEDIGRDAETLFPQPGKDTDNKWACTGLEKLAIRVTWMNQGESEEHTRQEVCRPMYRQLGEMPKVVDDLGEDH